MDNSFLAWLKGQSLSEATAKKYSGAIMGALSVLVDSESLANTSLDQVRNLVVFRRILIKLENLSTFREMDRRGHHMYSAALKKYEEYLLFLADNELSEDLISITSSVGIPTTVRETLVHARTGQGLFRSNLITYWKKCALTGYPDPRVLVASHIKPWRASSDMERLDVWNGLLFVPNIDKLFDTGLISFSDEGYLLASPSLSCADRLGVSENMKINFELNHIIYIQYHREHCFISR